MQEQKFYFVCYSWTNEGGQLSVMNTATIAHPFIFMANMQNKLNEGPLGGLATLISFQEMSEEEYHLYNETIARYTHNKFSLSLNGA